MFAVSNVRPQVKTNLLVSVSGFALVVFGYAPIAYAQTGAQQAAQVPVVEEVVVTGSRIVRDGYEAPTPVTVVGAEQLMDAAKPNVFDAISSLPAFSGNINLSTSTAGISMGTGGSSTLNLRGLGVSRTLVLFDSRRFPNIFVTGGTDAKLFPDLLISRVDVVTGGASAVYGSDAVSGVVNFVLDKEFAGIKGNVMGGITSRGDHEQYKFAVAAGTPFAGGRGHVLFAADVGDQAHMEGKVRDWNQVGYFQISNPNYTPTNGQPQLLHRYNSGMWAANPGGVIAGGPLKGIAFGPGGAPYQANLGEFIGGSFNVGGDWRIATEQGANSLAAGSEDKHLYARASYDLSDDVTVFAEYNFGTVQSYYDCCWTYYLGANINVRPDNPFMPESVRDRATALGLTSLAFGKQLKDIPPYSGDNERNSYVYVVGAEGNFDAFDSSWSWDVYAQRGVVKLDLNSPIQIQPANFALAIDAVRGPSGAIVCRSSLTNPTNGCVPYNLFGTGTREAPLNSQAAINYVTSFPNHPHNSQAQRTSSAAFNVSGEPFEGWAGPISLAFGGEWRKESIEGKADPIAEARGWFSTNYITWPLVSQKVVEGNVETVVPLAKDVAWATALDFNGGVRITHYTYSGSVVTWKAGLTYNPVDDFRLRFTRSRDIRAPNLNDLFAPGQRGNSAIADPFLGNQSFVFGNIAGGNPNLAPEKADTTGIGGVYQPEWLPGFSTSLDYYNIALKGAIASPATTFILQQCFLGVQFYCPFINRRADGTIDTIFQRPVNSNVLRARGLDIEASYRTPLSEFNETWEGDLSVRAVATHIIALEGQSTTFSVATGAIGAGGLVNAPAPKWSGQISVSYSNDAFRFNWTTRYISSGDMFADKIACASGCPTPVPAGLRTVDYNYVPSYHATDIAFSYAFYTDGDRNAEAYLNVDNLFDRDPPPVAISGVAYSPMTQPALYDVFGRAFRVGVRFRM